MTGTGYEKDLERGDSGRLQIVDEKINHFDSKNSSPTLTQGSFRDTEIDKGMA